MKQFLSSMGIHKLKTLLAELDETLPWREIHQG